MVPGEVVIDRFEIEYVAGSGGMGTVYRANDRTTGEPVALKILRGDATAEGVTRFAREARLLAGMRHPGIVRYIADGQTAEGSLFLAMEWLEGETLAERITRVGLSATESIDLARRVAEALGAAHERGVVHRDVKPSNLFLPHRDLERVKVLDFGVARMTDATRFATRTGVMIGTPGYMAPEQVRGEKDVTARVDVFAVGCVLFECLTGRPVFSGEHMLAVLAKIVLEDAPRLAELRPDLPEALDDVIARALARNPEGRPRDGGALATELASIGHFEAVVKRTTGQMTAAITGTEQRLLCVILVGAEPEGDATISDAGEAKADLGDALAAEAAAHGADLEHVADGSFVITLGGSGSTSDAVMQAARCALAVKAIAPASPVALATGRGVFAGRWPVGEAIDRAVKLLDAPADRVRLDDVTAGILDTRFEVGGDDAGLFLVAERDIVEVTRTLLGKHTPCVGRDRELGVLYGLYEECIGEPMARAVIVTGAEGVGKSRVRHELLRKIRERGESSEIWIGRGDPLRAGSPFGMIAPALRRAAGIHDGEPLDVQRQKLRARVMRHASELARTTMFLGELIGAPFPDEESVELRAARQDPLLMSDQVRRAFEHFLAVETAAQPIVIVLEDMHWGDLPTTKLVDSALRALPDRPWIVIAFARPELHDLFPRLWGERNVQELTLGELTKKGAEKLVRGVLGDRATDTLVARIVEQAGGNALYLEELVRAVAGGNEKAFPDTVLALVQGRLERLEGDARKVLRAASVFGQRFWRGGVTKLLGGVSRETGTRAWIDELVERELVNPVPTSKFADDQEYTFRHAMVREAAYAMLTDGDRKLGHQLAGAWLERAGETDTVVLAEHYERGADLEKAALAYQRAAVEALAACDFAKTAALAEAGVRCRARGTTLGALRLAQAEAAKWSGDFEQAAHFGLEAMALLPFGSRGWFSAAGEAAEASGRRNDITQLAAIGEILRTAPDVSGTDAVRACVTANAHAAFQLFQHGNFELAQILLDHVELVARDIDDPGILARIYQTRSSRAMFRADPGEYLVSEKAAAAEFERAGDLRYACMQRGHVGYAYLEIGAYADAERWLRSALDSGWQLGLQSVVATAKHNLGRALQHQGRLDEAEAIEAEAVKIFTEQGDKRLEAAARLYLGFILTDTGDLDAADVLLRESLALSSASMRPTVLAAIARILLARRNLLDALAFAREAFHELETLGGVEEGEALVRLMLAETLEAVGDHEAAAAATKRAAERLVERAAKISDLGWRKSFLENIPEHARTMELVRRL
jgi:tetratricopeptide (TPR) repeat protein